VRRLLEVIRLGNSQKPGARSRRRMGSGVAGIICLIERSGGVGMEHL